MPRNSFTLYVIAVVAAGFVSLAAAETDLITLNYNPFSRPGILKKKNPRTVRVIPQVSLQPEEIELEFTATIVSENAPMVIVNGEMLGIGEKIGKMKLIAVLEGKAIFIQGGKKYSFTIDEPDLK